MILPQNFVVVYNLWYVIYEGFFFFCLNGKPLPNIQLVVCHMPSVSFTSW